jgi:cellulose synthase/poly-beta-1,6-N-acetylglucosamine synthase-like glycosyltransferase
VVFEPRKGVVWARQKGFESAYYPHVVNIDADSRLPHGWLKAATRHFLDSEVVAVSGPLVFYDLSSTIQFSTKMFYLVARAAMLVFGTVMQGGNAIIKYQTLHEMDGYDTLIEFYGEDTMTAKRASRFGKVVFEPEMWVYASGRRLEKQGVLRTAFLYTLNYLSVVLCNKSVTHVHKDYR